MVFLSSVFALAVFFVFGFKLRNDGSWAVKNSSLYGFDFSHGGLPTTRSNPRRESVKASIISSSQWKKEYRSASSAMRRLAATTALSLDGLASLEMKCIFSLLGKMDGSML